MFIVTLLVLTVVLSYVLAGAAGDTAIVDFPAFGVGHQPRKSLARDLILSNRFWIYLILGIGATLLTSTTIAIALIMHVGFATIATSLLAIGFFAARAFAVNNGARRRRSLQRVLQLCGACSAIVALTLVLRA